jgi:hypothetical protein
VRFLRARNDYGDDARRVIPCDGLQLRRMTYTPNAALAPPPPFMASVQSYGPPVPAEIAMVQMMNTIMPAAGDGFPTAELPSVSHKEMWSAPASRPLMTAASVSDLAGQSPMMRSTDSRIFYSGGQMTVQFTFALPSPVKKSFSCR